MISIWKEFKGWNLWTYLNLANICNILSFADSEGSEGYKWESGAAGYLFQLKPEDPYYEEKVVFLWKTKL